MTATLNLAALSTVLFSYSGDNRAASARFRGRNPIRAVASTTAAPATSLYEVLRVDQDASPAEIKSAFRSLAKLYHPDVVVRPSPESEDGAGDFIEIRNAYETLSDPSARAMYDLSLMGRRRPFPVPLSMNRSPGFYSTRSWETDQCW